MSGTNEFEITFWRDSQYESFEEAELQGGTYEGETMYGYTNYADMMLNVKAACLCLGVDDLVVRVKKGMFESDKPIVEWRAE